MNRSEFVHSMCILMYVCMLDCGCGRHGNGNGDVEIMCVKLE